METSNSPTWVLLNFKCLAIVSLAGVRLRLLLRDRIREIFNWYLRHRLDRLLKVYHSVVFVSMSSSILLILRFRIKRRRYSIPILCLWILIWTPIVSGRLQFLYLTEHLPLNLPILLHLLLLFLPLLPNQNHSQSNQHPLLIFPFSTFLSHLYSNYSDDFYVFTIHY